MRLCDLCKTPLFDGEHRCPSCKRSVLAPAVQGPVIRPKSKPRMVPDERNAE